MSRSDHDDDMQTALDEVLLIVAWYAKYGRTVETRLRAAQVELSVRILDHSSPSWRQTLAHAETGRSIVEHLPPLDLATARSIISHFIGASLQ